MRSLLIWKPSLPDSPDPEEAAREARSALLLALVALIAIVGAVGVAAVALRSNEAATDPTIIGVPESASATIGPALGAAVDGYIANRKAALASASGTRLAVVSLTSYRTEADARKLLGDASSGSPAQVVALLVAVPGDAPAVVRGPLAAFVAGERASLQQQHDDIAQLLATVGPDKAYGDFYAKELDRLTKALAALDPNGTIVFGAVVRAPADGLRAVADRPAVRLVDVGGAATVDEADSTYTGVLPDEVSTVGQPQQRPAPPG